MKKHKEFIRAFVQDKYSLTQTQSRIFMEVLRGKNHFQISQVVNRTRSCVKGHVERMGQKILMQKRYTPEEMNKKTAPLLVLRTPIINAEVPKWKIMTASTAHFKTEE